VRALGALAVPLLTLTALAACSSTSGSSIGLGGLVGSWSCTDSGNHFTGTLDADGNGTLTSNGRTISFVVEKTPTGFFIDQKGYPHAWGEIATVATPLPQTGKIVGTDRPVSPLSVNGAKPSKVELDLTSNSASFPQFSGGGVTDSCVRTKK
jgi:hypothetical protein